MKASRAKRRRLVFETEFLVKYLPCPGCRSTLMAIEDGRFSVCTREDCRCYKFKFVTPVERYALRLAKK